MSVAKLTLDCVKMPRPTERSGPLAGHVRRGGTYRSPIAATGVLAIGDWIRDDLPDLLWPALYLAHKDTTNAAHDFVRWQEDVLADLNALGEPIEDRQFLSECLNGRLTGLDRLAERLPEAKDIVVRRAGDRGLLPEPVANALATYPQRPAAWLTDREPSAPELEDLRLLSKAVREAVTDGHRDAVLKCLHIWAAVQAGTFRSDKMTIELLKPYPKDPATRPQADTVVRASWGASRGAMLVRDERYFDAALAWARVFWDFNSVTTKCVRGRDLEARAAAEDKHRAGEVRDEDLATVADGETDPLDLGTFTVDENHDQGWMSQLPETSGVQPKDLRQRAMDMMSSYVEALEIGRPFRLYDPAPHEVHAGLVSRAAREVITALGAPDLWCTEHGSHVGRVVVESRIVLAWMSTQDDDIYRAYKDYGAGKAKLYSRIAQELPSEWLVNGASEAIEQIEKLSHNHGIFDHVVVDTRSTFAEGKPLRIMAEEVGMLDLYRHSYQLQSGVTHSEWWSVEEHAMERCRNILHRGHLIPSLSLSYGGNVDLARSWIIGLYGLIRMSLQLLGTNEEAVAEAFAWLHNNGVDQGHRDGA
jgi:hypothetical protein